jgi:hypothetical protein
MVTTYQYPQYLYALHNDEAIQAPNGSWEPGAACWELKGICREETNGKGNTIQTAGGQTIVFASLIQIPKGTPRINEGTELLVSREEINHAQLSDDDFIVNSKITGLVVVSGICQKYDFGRLHCRLWI